MSELTVIGTFHLREGQEEAGRVAFASLAEQTLAEEGCLAYAFHHDTEDPRRVVGVERWTSKDALDAHMKQPYVADLVGKAETLLDEPFTLQTLIPFGD